MEEAVRHGLAQVDPAGEDLASGLEHHLRRLLLLHVPGGAGPQCALGIDPPANSHRTRVPWPGVDPTANVAPIRLARYRMMRKPTPGASRDASGNPLPLSRTSSATCPFCCLRLTRISVGSACSAALRSAS